jgi:hypothetical protein
MPSKPSTVAQKRCNVYVHDSAGLRALHGISTWPWWRARDTPVSFPVCPWGAGQIRAVLTLTSIVYIMTQAAGTSAQPASTPNRMMRLPLVGSMWEGPLLFCSCDPT